MRTSWFRTALAAVLVFTVAAPAAAQQAPKKGPPKAGKDKAPSNERAGGPKPIVVERVVAVVNDTVILESELYQRAAPELAELEGDARQKQKQFKAVLRRVLDEMIDEELVLQAAAEAELDVTPEEVERAIADVKKSNKLTDAQFAEALAAQGYSMAAYKKDVRRQILRLRAVNVMVRPRVNVSDDDVKEHYDKLSRKAGAVTEIHVAHLLIGLPENPTDEELDQARRRAGELVDRARAGEDWKAIVLAASEDPGTKQNGGDLGWFKRGELPTEWEEQLFASDAGDIRGPIAGPRGLHVFHVVDVKKDALKPFEEVKNELKNELYADEMEKQTRVWLEELRRRAHVEVKL